MYFRKAGQRRAVAASTRIKHWQFELIFKSAPVSILVAVFAATTQFLLLNTTLDSPLLDIWLMGSLLVYLVAYILLRLFARNKARYRADYERAEQVLLVFVILTAALWGSSGLAIFPLVDARAQIIVLLLTMAVVIEIVSTLSYRHTIAIAFIALTLVPFMVGIYIAQGVAVLEPHLSIFLLMFYLLILMKIVTATHRNLERLLNRQTRSVQRERELIDKSELANQLSRDKSEFIANMSHEMRTPMHAILGFSDLGSKKSISISRKKLGDYFLRINESGQRLLSLLDTLIELSNLEAGRVQFEPEYTDMRYTIESVIAQMKPELEQRSINIDLVSKIDPPMAHYDNDKLMLVVTNILSNAIELSPVDSVIRIVIEEASLPSNSIDSAQARRPALSVSVIDQGVGIAESELESIFDKLAQSSKKALKTGDSGLGLSICKEIIQRHSGEIAAQNNTVAGATIRFSLPVGDQLETEN